MKSATRLKWILFFALCIPAIYICFQIFRVMNQNYTTQIAERYTMSDTVFCRGIIGMTETDIAYDGTGVLAFAVENGARVAAGSVVAQQFAGAQEAAASIYARHLQVELEALQKSQGNTTGVDMSALQRQRYAGVYDALDCTEQRDYANLAKAKAQIQVAENRAQLVTGRATDFTEYAQSLQGVYDGLNQTGTTAIAAPASGYFVSGEDSVARLHGVEALQQMNPTQLRDAATEPSPANASTVAGKIISDYKWRFFTTVTLAQADKIEQSRALTVSFPNVSTEKIPAAVQSIVRDEENDLAKIEILCDYINGDVVKQEHADAVLHFREYEGLRIDKRAERYQGETRGVYVRSGNMVYFRRIEPIFENESYYLVPLTPDAKGGETIAQNQVRMFDVIVVEGKNLSDGKMM